MGRCLRSVLSSVALSCAAFLITAHAWRQAIVATCTGDNWVGYCQQLNGRVLQAEQHAMAPKRTEEQEADGLEDKEE
jgi:hypothetical protein